MNLTALALRRPVTILMALVGLVVLGAVSYFGLPVRQLPNIRFPVVEVLTDYPGASPADVMNLVSDPLENSLATLGGVVTMTATSQTGHSRILLRFSSTTDLNAAASDVASAVRQVENQMPSGATVPVIVKANPNALPILDIAVSGPSLGALSTWTENTLVPRLEEVPGVGQVATSGESLPQVQVFAHPAALAAHGTSLVQIWGLIADSNGSAPAGTLTEHGTTYQVRTLGNFQSLAALRGQPVAGSPDAAGLVAPVGLSDVAQVAQSNQVPTSLARMDGHPAVGVSITAQSGASSLAVDGALRAAIRAMALPRGTRIAVTSDASVYTRSSLAAVQADLFLAILLAGIVLVLFLHRLRHTVIVLLAIPTSLVSTFAVMGLLHFNLDLVSLAALSLLIGILVDDSIVVLENIHRHLSLGKAPGAAALQGRMEIGGAAVAITLTDVVVYAPMAFVGGNIGQIFREFGMTIVAATLFSLFVSFTLTPLMAARWLRPLAEEDRLGRFAQAWDRGFERLRDVYARVVDWALDHRAAAAATAVASLLATASLIPLGVVGTSFIPPSDSGLFTVSASLPPGTPLSTTDRDLGTLAARLRRIPGVASTFAVAGAQGATYRGHMDVTLSQGPRASIFAIEAQVRRLAADIPHLSVATATQSGFSPGDQAPIAVTVTGPDQARVARLARQIEAQVARVPHLVEVALSAPVSAPEITVAVHRQEAARFGVPVSSVAQTVAAAVQGATVSQYRPSSALTQEPIVLELAPPVTPARVLSLTVPGAGGREVPLSAFASVRYGTAPTQVQQQNRLYAESVDANLAGQAPLGPAVHAIQARIRGLAVPAGYRVSFGAQVQQQSRAFTPLLEALAVSVLLVYMLMAALYESLALPLAVMLALPFALVGALAALALTGQTLNIFSLIGLIMLTGLVAKNAILLVDYTGTLRGRGMERRSAIVEAGRTRLRPILMTTATMVFAMLPLALHIGSGSAFRSSMSVVVIGGLISSTVLTLVVVPVLYSWIDDRRRPSARA